MIKLYEGKGYISLSYLIFILGEIVATGKGAVLGDDSAKFWVPQMEFIDLSDMRSDFFLLSIPLTSEDRTSIR